MIICGVNNTLIKHNEDGTLNKNREFMMIAEEQNYGITPYINNKSEGEINERNEKNEESSIIKMFLLTN